ncbi:unnamed protein product [Rhizophagus irregularis]|nr:unnamed protein product [Rhizophagus irregularis]
MNNLQKKKSRNNDDNSSSSTSNATLIINDRSIDCKITPSNKGERVLGIYINAHNKTHQTISKAKMIVYSHYIALAKKKMTHDQVKSQLNILSALFNTAVLRPIVLQKLDVLSSEICNYRTLTTPLTQPVNIPQRLHRSPKITQGYITHRFEWTIHWHNETRQTLFGKTLAQDSNNHSSITYSEHFIPLRIEDLALMNVPNNQIPLVLIPCSGCRLDSYYPSMDARPKCVLSNQTRSLNIFNVHKSASREHKFFLTSMKQLHYKKYFVSTKPHYTLNHVAYNIFLQRAGITTSQVAPNTTTLPINQISSNDPLRTIEESLLCNDMIKNDLKNISTNFANFQNFHFYTDE